MAATLVLLLLATGRAETLLVTSDWHLTADAGLHAEAMRAVLEAAEGRDAVIVLGDNTNNSRKAEHELALERLAALADRAETFAIPGNHDLGVGFDSGNFAAMYGDYGWDRAFSREAASASCAVTTRGGTCVLLLDTNARDASGGVEPRGGISDATVAWVESVLASLEPGTTVVACGHHPILPAASREEMGTKNAGALAEALRRGGVGLYLCGHDHSFAAVREDGLQQITVGQPQAYPGWAGLLELGGAGIHWRLVPLYEADDPAWREMEARALALGESMGRQTLVGTPHEGDEGAIAWFCDCFDRIMRGELTEAACAALLADPNAQKWREVEPKSVVKPWLFGILENCPQDVREIWIEME